MMRRLPTLVLRAIAVASLVAGVLVCAFGLPHFGSEMAAAHPAYASLRYPLVAGLYAAAGCFFVALFHFWLLLSGIDRDGTLPLKNLRAIRHCAIVFSVLYFLCAMPVIYLAADAGDAPGVILIGASLDLIPIGVAAVASVLERIAAGKYV